MKSEDFIRAYVGVADRELRRTESEWARRIMAGENAPFTLGVAILIKDRERARRRWLPAVRYQRNVVED